MRRQLPSHSPLTLPGIARAALAATTRPAEAVRRLERELGSRFLADEVILTGSGTQALELALRAALHACGDPTRPVAMPAYSCYDLVTAAVGAAAAVVFYDVDPRTLAPVPESVARALEASPAALVAGSLFGYPIDWEALRSLSDRVGAVLVEDAAQGLGTTWDGRAGGTFGDLTILSFARGKGWTGGSGGALLRRSDRAVPVPRPARAPSARSVRDLALCLAQWSLGRPGLFWLPAGVPGVAFGDTVYKEPSPAHGSGAFAAAAVWEHRELATAQLPGRQARAERWRELLSADDRPSVRPCEPLPGGRCSFLRLPLRATGEAREALSAPTTARWGVGRGYPVALPALPQVRPLLRRTDEAPGAAALARELFTLPTHARVQDRDLRGVLSLLDTGK